MSDAPEAPESQTTSDGGPVTPSRDVRIGRAGEPVPAALRHANLFLDSIIEHIPDMIFVKDARDLRFVRFNKAGEDLLGYGRADMIGKSDYDFFPPDEVEFFIGKDRHVLESGQVEDIPEEPIKTRNRGVRFLHTKKVPIYDAEGNPQYLLGISEDITERKKDREFRDVLIAELEAKNRELERFSYTVSHDLKAPLITISGFLGLLERGLGDQVSEQARDDMRRIGDAARRMQAMLDDLLELSRIGRVANTQEDVNLRDVVEDAVSLLAGRLRQADVQVTIGDEFPRLVCDRARIVQVFQNLIDNAAKHMGPGSNRRIEIGAMPHETSAVCFVRDNGVGIDPKYQDEIFGLFRRLQESGEGTGIGLTLVKRIVEVHGGCVWVDSAVGKGAAFYFAIPFLRDPQASLDCTIRPQHVR